MRNPVSLMYCADICPFGLAQRTEMEDAADSGGIPIATEWCPAAAVALTGILVNTLDLDRTDHTTAAAVTSTGSHFEDQVNSCIALTDDPETTTIDAVRTISGKTVIGELLGSLPKEHAMELFPKAIGLEN